MGCGSFNVSAHLTAMGAVEVTEWTLLLEMNLEELLQEYFLTFLGTVCEDVQAFGSVVIM